MAQRSQQIYDLFTGVKRYQIPLYQRRYVWSRTNWDALWRDLTHLKGKKHFTGTIITKFEGTDNQDMIVIDGQQRLITFQIIFRLSQDLWKSEKYTPNVSKENLHRLIYKVESYTQLYTGEADSDGKYRLLITKKRDKEAFESVISGELWKQQIEASEFSIPKAFESLAKKGFNENGEQSDQHLIITAYGYFGMQITSHLEDKTPDELVRLIEVLENRFHVISANLETEDDPQQAYGSSNDTGVALDEFDLLRNDLFLRVEDQAKEEEWYNRFWRGFDVNEFWEKPGRMDEFLRCFLTAKLGPKDFSRQRLFHNVYKTQYLTNLQIDHDVKMEFVELAKYAESYRFLEDANTNIGCRMQFYYNLGITNLLPFILYLKNELDRTDSELEQVCDVLESYIMRRMVNYGYGANDKDQEAYKKIGQFFSRLIAGEKFSVRDLVQFLRSGGSNDSSSWPTNAQILGGQRRHRRSGVTAGGLQRTADEVHFGKHSSQNAAVSLLRYIFYRIERYINIENTLSFESFLSVPTRLAVLPDESRDWRSIGNLTFRAENGMDEDDVNSSPFYMIKVILLKHPNASVKLNKDICGSEDWSVEQIRERTRKLGSYFREIWPDANSFLRRTSTSALKSKTGRLYPSPEIPDDKFDTKRLYEGVVKYWGSDYSFSYIESNELPWLQHDIEVISDSLDPSILSRKLHPGLKVKFNLSEIIQRDGQLRFQANNVTLFTTGRLYQGEVKWVEPGERFGFLISSAYPDDIYMNKTQLCSEEVNSLKKGQMLEFNIAETVEGKYSAAINVRPVKS